VERLILMKILVTGALGFIGSNICERLVKDGHAVIALDNMHTGSEANIARIKGRIKVVKAEAGDLDKLGDRFDAIIHEGVYSSSPMYRKDPQLVPKAIGQWISILEYARKHGCRLVYASSSSMYNKNKPPYTEDMQIKVTDLYTEARYAMERMAELYHDFYGVRSIGLRYFSVYGQHEEAKKDFANLITQFLWKMRKGERPVILGDGLQSRDFTYVDDVVEANMLALSSGKHGVYNVGTGKAVSLNEVVQMLNQKLGTKIEPVHEPNRIKNYVAHTLADTSKAKSELGFSAKVGLDAGVSRLVACYK
jgi:UDP-glucose 4-epimerase